MNDVKLEGALVGLGLAGRPSDLRAMSMPHVCKVGDVAGNVND